MPSPTSLVVKNGSKMRARVVGVHARARVADLDRDPAACRALSTYGGGAWSTSARAIVDRAAAGHRLDRVDDEVREHLLELAVVGLDAQRCHRLQVAASVTLALRAIVADELAHARARGSSR